MTMADLGSDFACIDDLDPELSVVTGRINLGHAIARRLITPRGSLWYDSDYGYDVRGMLNRGYKIGTSTGQIDHEGSKDERVKATITSVIQRDKDGQQLVTQSSFAAIESLDVRMQLTDSDGPFTLTLSVDAVTAKLLMGT